MAIKPGVSITGLQPEMAIAYAIAAREFHRRGFACVITSGTDDANPPRKTMEHRTGRGLDLRTWNCGVEADRKVLANAVAQALGRDFQVLLEKLGQKGEHLHIGFRPQPS